MNPASMLLWPGADDSQLRSQSKQNKGSGSKLSFKYDALVGNEFRLLFCQHNGTEDTISLQLGVFSLDRPPSYVVLDNANHEIVINGKPFYIQRNLFQISVAASESNRPFLLLDRCYLHSPE